MVKVFYTSSGRRYCGCCNELLNNFKQQSLPNRCPGCGKELLKEKLKADLLFFQLAKWGLNEMKRKTL